MSSNHHIQMSFLGRTVSNERSIFGAGFDSKYKRNFKLTENSAVLQRMKFVI